MDNLVVFVEAGMPDGNGGRANLYFEKGVTHPRGDGKACDLTVLSDRLIERLPSMLIINSNVSIHKKEGCLFFDGLISTINSHNWICRSNPVRKLILNRCEEVDAISAMLKSIGYITGIDVEVAVTNIDEKFIRDLCVAQQDSFFVNPDKPLKATIDYGTSQYDLAYSGCDPNFIYSTVKL